MIKISAIVPNYNSGRYIKRCLDSLLNQTYSVEEIIVVDDCSTDESLEIIKEYQLKYSKVKVEYNLKNMGVSFSRNTGIDKANCEYILFCDGDDWYEDDAVEKMVQALEKNKADFVFGGYYIAYDYSKKIQIKFDNAFPNELPTKDDCISSLPITSCAKLMKKSVIVNNDIKYPENIRNCEELSFIPIVAIKSEKVVYLNQCIYNYFQRNNSASNKKIDDLSFFEISYKEFKKQIDSKYNNAIIQRMIEHLLYSKTLVMIRNGNCKADIFKHIKSCEEELTRNKSKRYHTKITV